MPLQAKLLRAIQEGKVRHPLRAARLLGISKTTLYKKQKAYGLESLGTAAWQAQE